MTPVIAPDYGLSAPFDDVPRQGQHNENGQHTIMSRRDFLKKTGAVALGATALPAPKAWAGEEKFVWNMVTTWPPNLPVLQTGAQRFAERVLEMSGGRLRIQVYAGGELVPAMGFLTPFRAARCSSAAALPITGPARCPRPSGSPLYPSA
jgi:hypothetical protein